MLCHWGTPGRHAAGDLLCSGYLDHIYNYSRGYSRGYRYDLCYDDDDDNDLRRWHCLQ